MKLTIKVLYFFSKTLELISIIKIEKSSFSRKKVESIEILTKDHDLLNIRLIDNIIDFIFIKIISLSASTVLFNRHFNLQGLYGYKHMLIKCKSL